MNDSSTTQPMTDVTWLARLDQQLRGGNPFQGDAVPSRVPLLRLGRPSLPFPHPWNFHSPIQILETYFWNVDEQGLGRHNRYLDVPGFAPWLVTRDPSVIRAILLATGDKPGQFDRDSDVSAGIARSTGEDTLLHANGPLWRHQRKLAAPSFGCTTLFQPERFHEFEATFRRTVTERLERLAAKQASTGERVTRVALEGEIAPVMLEMLVNNFFGGDIPYDEIRERYVPAITMVIGHMVRDSIAPRLNAIADVLNGRCSALARARADFESLTDVALSGRANCRAHWSQFKSDAPDAALRSNLRVFLAGALEATTSFAAWAISHLSRAPELQERVYAEVKDLATYDPEDLTRAVTLRHVLEETLRLTPALYFLPRRAPVNIRVDCGDGRGFVVPRGTHLFLDVWHANRCDEFWGEAVTGYPAESFAPERWTNLAAKGRSAPGTLHFGFGFGPRVCPGKFLGLLEVGLAVGAFVKIFRFRGVHDHVEARAGVTTKPADGVLLDLERRS